MRKRYLFRIDYFRQQTTYQYDTLSREIATTDPLGKTACKEYDALGNVTTRIDKDGYKTKILYNLYGAPLEIHYPDGTSERFVYNLEGHLVQEWKRDGTSVTYPNFTPLTIKIGLKTGIFANFQL